MRLGIDIGSTTLKCVLLSDDNNILYSDYKRHYSKVSETILEMLSDMESKFPNVGEVGVALSGSAGMGYAESIEMPFVQEVYATKVAVDTFLNGADIVIELGGEDAKILFLSGGLEVRMNGSCAGGTGAFIDQMATLLSITPTELNELAKDHTRIYSIASRCGVFAKSDIQPLLNQGAKKSDVAASIFYAVANQTVAGLAQGRELKGEIVYLGGPLTFMSELRNSFDDTLKTKGLCPQNSLYFVAMGTALLCGERQMTIAELKGLVSQPHLGKGYSSVQPLFKNQAEYDEFTARHARAAIPQNIDGDYSGNAYIGVDSGSTTVKLAVIDEQENILFSKYTSNGGNPVALIREFLAEFYAKFPNVRIAGSAITGYGEEMIKHAFLLDFGIVETVAHFYAAKRFNPQVDFIIDIGGQDIKCFKIADGAIDDIFLNEACSSGCGSFLQSFAAVLGFTSEQFAKQGLFAPAPVDLGSRCTVFMNSSVKQAQKDGASVENISAGLSISVVKNALYKVIRATSAKSLGKNIVVQGGTFLNDAVLRAFEQEIGADVIRPTIAGLMGAYGAALYAKEHIRSRESTILDAQSLTTFSHDVQAVTCNKCNNHCSLTVNTFDGDRKFIGGNRCERPIISEDEINNLNMYKYKRDFLREYRDSKQQGTRGRIGIPLGLNMYELLPFWYKFFNKLGFEVVVSPFSTRALYLSGQKTIPSDTVCFPAKLMHGHIEYLLRQNVDAIFYPCMTYNLDENMGDNHYNCPVVAYYPEVIAANVEAVKKTAFIYDYVGIHRPKDFADKIEDVLSKYFEPIPQSEIKAAVDAAYKEYDSYFARVREKADELIKEARAKDMPIIVLAGRPYHLDPEINHGIDKLVCSLGAAVITEDSISHLVEPFRVNVLNQWTYHSRLYAAAKYVTGVDDINLVQLVSFGCGVDAITTDEVRTILSSSGKVYTQIKIDEITNLGAVKIRLRSLFATMPDKGNEDGEQDN